MYFIATAIFKPEARQRQPAERHIFRSISQISIHSWRVPFGLQVVNDYFDNSAFRDLALRPVFST